MAWKRGTAQPLARDRVLVQRNDRIMPGSSQHPLQLLDPLQDLLLDRAQFGQDLQRWPMLHLVVHQLLVAVEAEVVALGAAAG